MKSRWTARLLAACTVLALALAAAGVSAETVIKLAHPNRNDAFDNTAGAMAIVFKNHVEVATERRVRVEIFPEGQMGRDGDAVKLVRQGTIQSAISSVGGVAPLYPMLAVIDLPFAYSSVANAYDVFDGPFGHRLAEEIRRKVGLAVLGFGDPGGLFTITNSKRPIRQPEDMKGLKIRTMDLETHRTMIGSLGGTPVNVAWSDLYNALGTGAVDGQMNPVPIVRFARFDEVQRHLTLSNHLFLPYVWVMNAKFLDDLAPGDRAAVMNGARLGVVASRGLSRLIESSDRGLPPLAQRMEVHTLTPREAEAFRKVTQPAVRQAIERRFGAEGVEMLAAFERAIREERTP
ncbi:tripartite ATP-independent transporter DctP family solute receptor [Azospirillum brasilense]|nr:tripartite ATP-independent transporter DctP family solute receptor [Azospirillum brasilense]